ncbi:MULTISPECIES: TlpA family protein disulfide reductase [unclassified Polaribacter]|uniref:TlpA family protein disulfide reductase n=1 Tax=unclassified Polaribacter TaxID=196858 RepID=UPI0011BFCBB4|nr:MULTISPECIES: TlpA family protein disulfide reductase [unclassified Polaribacter]TXD53892.1 redoxin domain-containing protein [Polaribacter sp. IC063]TXD58538.1 redoxin domain-containing protein [Polaribacter sp. IC066]
MKKIILLFLLTFIGCTSNEPKEFSEKALQDMLIGLDSSKLTFREVLMDHKGKKILIDVWASWCKDCVTGVSEIKKLQKEFPEVAYVFLSVDFSKPSWKRFITKHNLVGDHYNLPKGMNSGDFVDFINLGWIPRYIVVDEKGGIQLFNATKASDKRIVTALKNKI